jgi:predicted  nucleic acid-binding Zn-ribbon protein
MAEQETKGKEQAGPIQEVDRIRDIIFGPQMRDYQDRFQQVTRDLQRLEKELGRLSQQLADQDSNQSKKLQALRRELREADDDLRGELRRSADQLTNDKVSRESLGELFIDLGTRLKGGGSLSDLLETLAESDEGKDRGD